MSILHTILLVMKLVYNAQVVNMHYSQIIIIWLLVGTRLTRCLPDRNGFFIKTTNLSQSNWIQAIQGQTKLPATTIECASLCKQFDDTNDTQSQCNAFKYDKPSKICYLAEVTFLEDHQPGVVNEEFHVAFDVTKNVKLVCYGGDHCCRPENPCVLNEGDCNSEHDCTGWANICGINNCLKLGISNRLGSLWTTEDDCCERRCTPEHPCPQSIGDCDADIDCQRPTWQKCEPNGCLNRNYFPLDQFPNNTIDR
jgi:hypothetical protein